MNDALASLIVGVSSLVCFICYVLLLIQMFQRGMVGLGIAFIALTVCCGLGMLIGLIYGWTKARVWNLNNLMTVWTVAFAIDLVAGIINPSPFRFVGGTFPR